MVCEFNVVLLGSAKSGKTALLVRMLQDTFIEPYDPTIEDSYIKHIQVSNKMYRLIITDVGGDDNYGILREQCLRKADGVLIVFDLNSMYSYQYGMNCLPMVERCRAGLPKIPYVIVANKTDLKTCDELISHFEGCSSIKNWHDVPYIRTSAKNNEGVHVAFAALTYQMLSDKNSRSKKLSQSTSKGRRRETAARNLRPRMLDYCTLL